LFIDKNYLLKPYKPQIFLCKPNKTIVAKLSEAYNVELTVKLGNINELIFDVPYELDYRNELKRNYNIDKVKERYLINVKIGTVYEEYFIINEIHESANSGEFKKIHAFSLGYELTDKLIRGYKCTSKNASQVLTDVLSSTIWSINYIDADFDLKYRSFEVSSKTVLDFVFEIAETFKVLIVWDTVNRKINFYDYENIGVNKGLKIKYGKYLNTLDKNTKSDDMTTRLKVYGKDGISIQRVNPTGSNYIEDFSYFIYPFEEKVYSDYMTNDLCSAILTYNNLVDSVKGDFDTFLTQIEGYETTLTTLNTELVDLTAELMIILDDIDVAQANGHNISTYIPSGYSVPLSTARNNKQTEVDNKQDEIDSIQTNIDYINGLIIDLRNYIAIENNFTPALLAERNQFIIEKEWSDENYIDDKQLYQDALVKFEDIKRPQTSIEIDIVNFLKVIEEQLNWDKLCIGDIITIEYEKLNINVEAKISEIVFNFENNTIKLTITNIKDIKTDKDEVLSKLYQSISTSTTVDMNKFKWNNTVDSMDTVSQLLNGVWDSSTRAINAGVNESVTIDRRGITIIDPTDPLKFMRATHGCFGMTNDGGNTFKTIANAMGIFASQLIGQIIAGANLTITTEDSSFTVNETGVNIDGTKLTITEGSNGINLDPTDGITINRTDDKVQLLLNANDGIKIQSKEGANWVNKFYADENGILKLVGIDVAGNIDCSSLKINGVSILNSSNKILANALEPLEIGVNIIMGEGVTVNWADISGKETVVDTANGFTYLQSDKIYSPTIEGGTITADTNINVSQNINLGQKLIFNPGSFTGGIQWGQNVSAPSIFFDPAGNTLTIGGTVGAIYAKTQRIDVPSIAVFG
jgi:hypothetical protein